MKQAIVTSSKSPLNKLKWLVALSCGHEEWVAQKTKPRGFRECQKCPREETKMEKKAREAGVPFPW